MRLSDWQSFSSLGHDTQCPEMLARIVGTGAPRRVVEYYAISVSIVRPKANSQSTEYRQIPQPWAALVGGQYCDGDVSKKAVPAGLPQRLAPVFKFHLEGSDCRLHARHKFRRGLCLYAFARLAGSPGDSHHVGDSVTVSRNLACDGNRVVRAWAVQREELRPVCLRKLQDQTPLSSPPRLKLREIALGLVKPRFLNSGVCGRGHERQELGCCSSQNRPKAGVCHELPEDACRPSVLSPRQGIRQMRRKGKCRLLPLRYFEL